MKSFLFFLFLTHSAFAQVAHIEFEPDTIFLPTGYSDSDNTQIIVDGIFPDSCYTFTNATAFVDSVMKKIYVTAEADHNEDDACLSIIVPYTQVINVGKLPAGEYSVHATMSKGFLRKGAIRISKSKRLFDKNYAPVDHLETKQISSNGDLSVKISGDFDVACAKLRKVKHEEKNTLIEVFPMSKKKLFKRCDDETVPFEHEFVVKNLPQERILVHVHNDDSEALNQVVPIAYY